MTCRTCGADNPGDMKFCGGCGALLANVCPSCRADNPPAFRFCGRCGGPLAAPATAPAAAATKDDAELRQLTVVFCDLVDSTGLSERLDPEDLRAVVREYHATCAEAIRRFGGHVAQYLGDGLLVYFGYPQAHEEDAQRAAHSGLGIVRGVERLNQRLDRERGLRIAVRIGIHTGPVVAGAVGAGGRSEQLAMGQTPNVAARLQALAEPGAVIISGATLDLVRGFFVCEPLGPQMLRGVSQPVEAHRVLRDTGVKSRFEVAVAKGLTPSVDRHRERAALFEAFERMCSSSGQVVWVVGEAGIGKSRLLQMFHERTAVHTPFWVLCRCSTYFQHSALYPVIELFQQLFGFETDDPPAERLRKLEAALVAYGPPQPEAAPLLAALFSLPLGEHSPPLGLTPERQKERTLETLLAILLRMAEAQPVVVGIEDLHWADPSTLEFLNLVMQKGASARIMLLLTHRPVFSPSWAARAPATHLRLDRLSDEHIHAMVEHITGGKRLPEEVHRYIAEKTDGVPIFIEELTRTVLDSGWLVEGDEGYSLGRPLQLLAIPATLQDLLLARLDRLGSAKDRALLASVLGREFTYEMLHAVSPGDEPSLRRDLSHLVDGGLLYQLGEPPLATYTFKHALIQDAAYGLLLKSTRQQYHRRVAETLAQRFPDVSQAQPELLAHHFTEAGLSEPAVGHWLRAARRAVERSANVEAAGHVRQGLALLEHLPASPSRDTLELGLQSTLGSATIALKGYGSDEVERAFARALDLCEQLGNAGQRFRAELGLWMYYVVRADYARALELAERLQAIAEAQGTAAALVHASYCIGFSRYYLGEIHAAHDAFAAGARLECADGDPALALPTGDDVRIHLLAFFGLVLWHRGQPAEAMARCEQAVALARRLSHPYGVVFALNAATYLAMYLRDDDRAKAAVGECLAIATDKGYRYFLLTGGFVQGWALAQAGAADEGIALMTRCIQAARGAGALMGQTLMMVHLAGACVRHKRNEEAATWLGEMAAAVEASRERFFEPELHRLRGERDVAVDAVGAEALFHRALDQACRQGDLGQAARAATSLARMRTDRGRGEARELLAACVDAYGTSIETTDLLEARALLDRLA